MRLFRLILLSGCLLPSVIYGQSQISTLAFSVYDDTGVLFTGLKPEDIRIKSKSGSLQPTGLSFLADQRLNLLIMVDVSVSQERTLPLEKQVAETFIDRVLKSGRDRVAVVQFTGSLNLVHDFSENFASVKARLAEVSVEIPTGNVGSGVVIRSSRDRPQTSVGSTSLFDSVHKAISVFAQGDAKGNRKVLLVISDGRDTYSDGKLRDVIEASVKAGIPIYAVGIGDSFFDGVDTRTLRKLAESTGGTAVFPKEKKSNLSELLSPLESRLRNTYVATFPAGKGSFQEGSVEIVNPALKRLHVLSPRVFF